MMSSAVAVILTAAMLIPASGSEGMSAELDQVVDLRGEWRGVRVDHELGASPVTVSFVRDKEGRRAVSKDMVVICCLDRIVDEGQGRFRGSDFFGLSEDTVGIYRQEGDRLVLCFQEVSRGRPTSFEARGDRTLLILYRVKPRE